MNFKPKNAEDEKLFLDFCEALDKTYDDDMQMLIIFRSANGYHSKLSNCYVHPTRESLSYAFELMNRDNPGDFERAEAIIKRVAPMQNSNPNNVLFGIWPYYGEEPLEDMAPADYNWADFCSRSLVHILKEYGDRLSDDVYEITKKAVLNACAAIKRRNVKPDYTNISIMGTYITFVTAELFGDEELFSYASDRLKALYDFNMTNGAFAEYNSPTYTMIAAAELAWMQKHIIDRSARKMVNDLNDLLWKSIAEHFHVKTMQWAGPHARGYTFLTESCILKRIERALDYKVRLLKPYAHFEASSDFMIDVFSADMKCPDKYVDYFKSYLGERRTGVANLRESLRYPTEIAISYMSENYTLGTLYRDIMWVQKRNLLAYFGTAENPIYATLLCLHDGYPYSSAVAVTAQEKNRALAIVSFITNGGDTHCNLDKIKDGKIEAKDLRIRFEFGCKDMPDLVVKQLNDNEFSLTDGVTSVKCSFPYIKFGNEKIEYKITYLQGQNNDSGIHHEKVDKYCIDAIIYSGDKKTLDFKEMEAAACGVGFEITDGEFSNDNIIVTEDNESLKLSIADNIAVSTGKKPRKNSEFLQESKAFFDKKEYLQRMETNSL